MDVGIGSGKEYWGYLCPVLDRGTPQPLQGSMTDTYTDAIMHTITFRNAPA